MTECSSEGTWLIAIRSRSRPRSASTKTNLPGPVGPARGEGLFAGDGFDTASICDGPEPKTCHTPAVKELFSEACIHEGVLRLRTLFDWTSGVHLAMGPQGNLGILQNGDVANCFASLPKGLPGSNESLLNLFLAPARRELLPSGLFP